MPHDQKGSAMSKKEPTMKDQRTVADVLLAASPLTDITSRAQSKNESDEWHQFVEHASWGMAIGDVETHTIRRVNPAYAALHGYTPAEMYGMKIDSLVTPESRGAIPHHVGILRKTGHHLDECVRLRKDGSTFHASVEITWIENASGKSVFISNVRDITEFKQTQHKVQEKEANYRRLYESLLDAFAMADMSGRLLEFNQAFQEMLGYSAEELQRLTYFDLTPKKWHPLEAQILEEQVLPHGQSQVYEKEYIRKDGTVFPVELKTILLRDNNNQPEAMWAIVRDISERKQAMDKLHLHSEILKNLSEGIYLIRASDGAIVFANPQFERMFGYMPGELLGKHVSIVNAPGEKGPEAIASAIMSEIAPTGEWNGEVQNIRKDGTTFWCYASVSAFDHPEFGKVWVSVHEDISERKCAESLLIESELQYRTLADSGQALIWTSGTDKLFNYFNQTWLDFTGRTLEQELGNGWAEGIHPDDYQRCQDVYDSAFHRRVKFSMDYRLRHHIGAYRWIQNDGCPRYDSQERFVGYIGHCLDITMHKENEQNARKSSKIIERYAAEIIDLYEHVPCGYHSVNKDGVFLRINETELKWLGYTWNEVVGKRSVFDLLSPDSLPIFRRVFPQFMETGEVHDIEVELIRKNGTTIPVMISATAVYDEEGCFVMSRTTVYDMTELKKMKAEREEYSKRQEAASRHLVTVQENARRRLSSELHDRTSPNLAAIAINLDVIATELPREYSAGLVDRMEDTRALISDTAASIREICADMRPPLLDYAGLSAALESYAQQFTRRTGIAVQFDCANGNIRLAPDLESLLFRIFQEALTNCAKHAHATLVTMTLNHGSRPTVLSVTDNGVGFDLEQLGRVEHIGLGVINMREIAEVAGGIFTIESAPGKGTSITVKFL